MRKKLMLILITLLSISVLLTGCGGDGTKDADGSNVDDGKTITLRVGHVLQEHHPTHTTLVDVFKKEVEEKTDGKIKVEIFPNAQLGGDRQQIEAVSLGSLEMCVPGGPVVSGFYEEYMIFDLPFLFDSREAAYAAWDGELGDRVSEGLESQNIVNLGYGENGLRHITNNERPIYTPEDMKGIKIRVMENPIHITTFKALGANPTPISYGELFTALQQKTVDAQETPAAIIYSSKFYEVQKYLTLDGHMFANCPYLINKDFYESLSPEHQEIIAEATRNTLELQRKTLAEEEKEYLEKLAEEGMEINEINEEQRQMFVEAVKPAYDQFEEQFGSELIDLAKTYNK